MTVITAADQFNVPDLFIDLEPLFGERLLLKCEGMNFAGSIKYKTAVNMLDDAARSGRIRSGSTLIESSSGNLGIALSMAAASRGYSLVCITDLRCNSAAIRSMEAYGATVEIVTGSHPTGMLQARIDRVRELTVANPDWMWLNQYENEANWKAHCATTGPEIFDGIGQVDVVFVGAGTCGTLMGVSRFVRTHSPRTRVIGIDSAGSVTFGGEAGVRHIPGLGAGVQPPFFESEEIDGVVTVDEAATVRASRALAQRGFLLGGSTGTVVAGAVAWLSQHGDRDTVGVAISADLGERYLETIYDDDWVRSRYGVDALLPALRPSRSTVDSTCGSPRVGLSRGVLADGGLTITRHRTF